MPQAPFYILQGEEDTKKLPVKVTLGVIILPVLSLFPVPLAPASDARRMLVALPADLLVKVLGWLPAADLARAAASCTLCRSVLERAARAHVLGRALPSLDLRPFLQLSPFMRIRMPWAFWLRVAEVRPCVLEALGPSPARDASTWLDGKHDAPTMWCIANELRIITNRRQAAAEEAARAEEEAAREAARAAREAHRRAFREAARARGKPSPKAHRRETSETESSDDWE